jgi:6-phosphogluconolactonase
MHQAAGSFRVLATAADVAAEAARRILAAADLAIADRGRFQVVLAGGRTPLSAYNLLVSAPADWKRWHIFLGDERCLGADDNGRNSVAAARAFVERVPIAPDRIHWIAAELGPAEAARRYEAVLSPRLPFDLVLLGVGDDGHTASLFPGHPVPPGRLVIPVSNAPKPPAERVSLTPCALAESRAMLILATGTDKSGALAAWRAGADLPVARVASLGRAQVLTDRAADSGSDGAAP